MTYEPPTIKNALFQMDISAGMTWPIKDTFPFYLPLNFANVSGVDVFRGVYTPNNDYLYLFQNRPMAVAPTFMCVCAGGHLNVSRVMTGGANLAEAVCRFAFYSWPLDATNYLSSVYLEGRTNTQSVMSQGTPMEYIVVIGQADIT